MDYKHKIDDYEHVHFFCIHEADKAQMYVQYMTLAGHQASSESVGTTTAAQNPCVLVFRFRVNLWVIEGIKAYS